MTTQIYSIAICLASFFFLIWLLRRDRMSFGLPIAYVGSLSLNHVPGAIVDIVTEGQLYGAEWVETGIRFTAISIVCFAVGVWWSRFKTRIPPRRPSPVDRRFWRYCAVSGLSLLYGLGFLAHLPTVGAAIMNGAAIWMLGVLLGIRNGLQRKSIRDLASWSAVLLVYPTVTLIFGGFLAAGSTAMIVVCSSLTVSVRKVWIVVVAVLVAAFIGLSVFVNYFAHRNEIRDIVWRDVTLQDRIDAAALMLTNFKWIDFHDELHQKALSTRLNQNYFIGLAAERLSLGEVQFLNGRSVWDSLLALVPRALWPDKPITGGSGTIVADMTGLPLNRQTSWGVGQVMEFYINFGIPGLVGGFALLGWLIGYLDRRAAQLEASGERGSMILYFLPAVALIQPIYSLVEITGSSAIALAAAYCWRYIWLKFSARKSRGAGLAVPVVKRPA
jgi:hypothetical protein